MSRNRNIEGMRAVLILWVILFHYTVRFHTLYSIEMPFYLENGGPVGVPLFYIISGFFMAKVFANDRKYSFKEICRQMVKRYWRFWPAYALSVIIIYVVVGFCGLPGREVSVMNFLVNLGFVYHPFVGYVDGAHCFLADLVFWQFALLMVLLIKNKIKAFHIISICVVVLLLFDKISDLEISHKLLDFFSIAKALIPMLFGVYLYCIYNQRSKYDYCLLLTIGTIIIYDRLNLIFLIYLILVIVLLHNDNFVSRWITKSRILSNQVIVYGGGISLYAYLLHQNIGFIIMRNIDNCYLGVSVALFATLIGSVCLKKICKYLDFRILKK